MVPNSAGGYAFAVDDWTRLERFLILGTEGGLVLRDRAGADGREREGGRALPGGRRRRGRSARSSQVSDSGRAPKNEPAVLALAIAAGMGHTAAASEALPKVCRTGTHLFAFAEAVQGLRGWGRGLRKGVAAWYEGKTPEALAYQVAKYQRRNGWSHRDLLRLAHPATADPARQAVYRWVVGGAEALGPREVKRGEAVASYPEVAAHAAAPARRDGRGPDGRPRGRHPADPRGRPAPRVHPDGAPERPDGLGGAAGGHAARWRWSATSPR